MTTSKTNSTNSDTKTTEPKESTKPKKTTAPKQTNKFMAFLHKLFGGINMSWTFVIVFAIIMGIYTALMAMLVPDGNSFHDIAVTPEWWVLPAVFIIVNCKKPLEAALKVFVFFLISQPLVYLIQVPFNYMGWQLFQYYPYWFKITLFTFPAGFIAWYSKKDQWYSGIILSVMIIPLTFYGVNYAKGFADSFPNHLVSVIYCFGTALLFIFAILKKWQPRLIAAIITVITTTIFVILANRIEPFEVYRTSYVTPENEFTEFVFAENPGVTYWTGDGKGDVEIINAGDGTYSLKLTGNKAGEYHFVITDDSGTEYKFRYHFDKSQNTIILELDD